MDRHAVRVRGEQRSEPLLKSTYKFDPPAAFADLLWVQMRRKKPPSSEVHFYTVGMTSHVYDAVLSVSSISSPCRATLATGYRLVKWPLPPSFSSGKTSERLTNSKDLQDVQKKDYIEMYLPVLSMNYC